MAEYDSPEDLAKAQRIHKAVWEREFKDRFTRKQEEAKGLVVTGLAPSDAVIKALNGSKALSTIPIEERLLKDLGLKELES
jgi:DNA-binding protein YbaB